MHTLILSLIALTGGFGPQGVEIRTMNKKVVQGYVGVVDLYPLGFGSSKN